jgi:integrase
MIVADVRSQQFNADAQDSGDFLEAMGLLGLGQAELAPLTRADIDLEAGRVITFRHKTSRGFAVPLFPQARSLFERLCEEKASGDRIFKIADAKKALRNACKRLELPRFSQRSLRRMFVTRAIEKGIDVKVIADWQRHRITKNPRLNAIYSGMLRHEQQFIEGARAKARQNIAEAQKHLKELETVCK